MALVNGSQILARSLRRLQTDTFFYLMGGPMMAAESACLEEGLRAIDVRHEQAAAMMAHAFGRVKNTIGVCMAASGPAATNLITGVANAWADCAPLLAIGGSAPISQRGKSAFQEMDQVAAFKPITKWAEQCTDPRRVPEFVTTAVRQALSAFLSPLPPTPGQPGGWPLRTPVVALELATVAGRVPGTTGPAPTAPTWCSPSRTGPWSGTIGGWWRI